jgi:hypothetical protein
MECAFYIYLFFLFPMQSVLWVSIYVCIKEGEEKKRDVVHCKRSSLVFLYTAVWDQYNAPENDACVLA